MEESHSSSKKATIYLFFIGFLGESSQLDRARRRRVLLIN